MGAGNGVCDGRFDDKDLLKFPGHRKTGQGHGAACWSYREIHPVLFIKLGEEHYSLLRLAPGLFYDQLHISPDDLIRALGGIFQTYLKSCNLLSCVNI